MSYDFTLDRKALISVLAGWVIMAVLLFAAGLIVGTYWLTSGPNASAAASARTGTSADDRAALPKEPDLSNEAPPLDGTAAPNVAAPAKPAAVAPGQVAGLTQPPAANTDAAGANKTAVPPVPELSEKATQEAALEPGPLAANKDNSAVNTRAYTVQVGVFLEQNEASRLLKDMERKGYAPSFFADRDAQDRQWYSIRIGSYTDKDQATNAAANFTRQEKIKAVVRPLGSL
jgi:cell division septation protein DedD